MRKPKSGRPARQTQRAGWSIEPDSHGPNSREPVRAGDGATDVSDTPAASAASESQEQFSNATVVLLGVFGGLYLLYTWGWFVIARAYSLVNAVTAEGSGVIGSVLQQIIFWVAPFAPLTWFLAAVFITRKKNPGMLGIALVIGAIVLLPLPWFLGSGSA